MEYLIWVAQRSGNICLLGSLQGFDDNWKIDEGTSVLSDFTGGEFFEMDSDYPRWARAADCMDNIDSSLVVSGGVKSFLQDMNVGNIEYLPVGIKNHKGRFLSDAFFVLHSVRVVDCLDVEASEVEYNPLDEEKIMMMERLILDESKLDPDADLFRVKSVPGLILVKRGLAKRIDAQGFSGVAWRDPESYSR